MTFAHPQLLWLLLAPAALLLAHLLPARTAAAVSHPKIPRARLSASSFQLLTGTKNALAARLILLPLALAALVLALSRPQGRTLATPTVTESRDVLVAVDVSRSMLADDLPPNRLTRARLLVRTLADELKGERLGLLPFAGTAFLQCPLSADYDIFRTFLDELGPDLIPAGGSNYNALLTAAEEAFGPATGSSPDAPATADRYLIILSDGEAQDDTWKPLAEKLVARGVRVIALGLGTPAGAMVPDGKGGLIKDERGAAVLSRLDASTLQELARLSDGTYRDASAWIDLPALLKETVSRGRTARTTTDTAPRREELFAWFLAPALALLAAALLREVPVTPRARQLRPPAIPVAAAVLGLFLLPPSPSTVRAAEAPPSPAPDPLVTLVGQLASAPDLAAPDLARLATLTADQGEKASPQSPAPPKGALQDALAAVNLGAALDPSAADWKSLRSRLDALLNPPKPPPQDSKSDQSQNQEKSDQNQSSPDSKSSSDQKSNNAQKSDPKDSSGSPDQDSSANRDPKSPGSSSSSPSSPGAEEPKDPNAPGSSAPTDSKPIGDLSSQSNPTPPPTSPDSAAAPPEPTQRAGGVSASGQPADGSATVSADPALAAPLQRLDRVRSADAPARLYQLMQESESPPDAESRAATRKRDW